MKIPGGGERAAGTGSLEATVGAAVSQVSSALWTSCAVSLVTPKRGDAKRGDKRHELAEREGFERRVWR